MTKKARQNLKCLEKKGTFKVKQKAFIIIFKGLSFAKHCLISTIAPLIELATMNTFRWHLPHLVGNTNTLYLGDQH